MIKSKTGWFGESRRHSDVALNSKRRKAEGSKVKITPRSMRHSRLDGFGLSEESTTKLARDLENEGNRINNLMIIASKKIAKKYGCDADDVKGLIEMEL